MKKSIFCLLAFFVAAAVCSGFVSCGDDDDENDGANSNKSALVGVWTKQFDGIGIIGIRLDKNGKAYYDEWDVRESPSWPKTAGKWNATDDVITISDPDGASYNSRYTLSEDKKTLYLTGDNTSKYSILKGTFSKQ